MAKKNEAWIEEVKRQQEYLDGIEPAPVEEIRRPGVCKCGHTGLGDKLAVKKGDIIRTCSKCKSRFNPEKGVFI